NPWAAHHRAAAPCARPKLATLPELSHDEGGRAIGVRGIPVIPGRIVRAQPAFIIAGTPAPRFGLLPPPTPRPRADEAAPSERSAHRLLPRARRGARRRAQAAVALARPVRRARRGAPRPRARRRTERRRLARQGARGLGRRRPRGAGRRPRDPRPR